jgi:Ca2+-binding RTX toxin-like protein
MATPILWSTSDFLVNTTTTNAQGSQQIIGLKDGTFLAIWTDQSAGLSSTTSYDIRGQIFNADGTKKGSEFVVNGRAAGAGIDTSGTQSNAKVTVLSDGRFVVAWQDDSGYGGGTPETADGSGGIRARIFNADGTPSPGGDFWVNTTRNGRQSEPSITALSNGGFVISYTTETFSSAAHEIKAQAFDASGVMIGGEVSVNTATANPQNESVIVGLNNGNYAVFYTDYSLSPDDPISTVRGRIFTAEGTQVVAEFLVPSSRGGKITPSVTALSDGNYVLDVNAEIEELHAASGLAAINLTGSSTRNKLFGNGAANVLDGGAGADTLDGGAGDDTYIIDDIGDSIIEGAGDAQGKDTVVIGADFAVDHTYDLSGFANVESLKALNSAGAVNLTGNTGANRITGNDSANEIRGGNDNVADTLAGGKGSDTYFLHDGNDIIVEAAGEGTDKVVVSMASFELAPDLSIEVLEADTSGGVSHFTLTGNNLANTISGAVGRDVLDGGAGDQADSLAGGAGDDTYIVRHEDDVVAELLGEGNDKITAHVSYVLKDSSLVETIEAATGTQTISLSGNSSANTITGNAGENVLEGRGGNDIIDGGGGLDTAVFTGKKAEYTITRNSDGSVTIADKTAGRDSSDTLKNIEYVRFRDAILDRQALPTLSIAATGASKAEGNGTWTEFTFTVTRSSDMGSSSAKWRLTGLDAGAGTASTSDFVETSGTVSFNDGDDTATITVKVNGDAAEEMHETFSVELIDLVGATPGAATSAAGVIINDDTPQTLTFAANDAVKAEGDAGFTEYTFTVTRSSGLGTASVKWTVTGAGTGTGVASDDDFDVVADVVEFGEEDPGGHQGQGQG